MARFITVLLFWAMVDFDRGISLRMDYVDEEATSVLTNSTKVDDDDVEVKHTIVVSTKLKNNNRKGIQGAREGDSDVLTYGVGRKDKSKKEDSGEVPVINGYKAVESTQIKTPDTRQKAQVYPESVIVNRNIRVRDDYDTYPNLATNPAQWKPSPFYNNINWWNPENSRDPYNFGRRTDRPGQSPVKFHRKITDDSMREFYCRKCRELSNGQGIKGCIQQRSSPWIHETTTPKIKIDGKLAKLN